MGWSTPSPGATPFPSTPYPQLPPPPPRTPPHTSTLLVASDLTCSSFLLPISASPHSPSLLPSLSPISHRSPFTVFSTLLLLIFHFSPCLGEPCLECCHTCGRSSRCSSVPRDLHPANTSLFLLNQMLLFLHVQGSSHGRWSSEARPVVKNYTNLKS